MLWPSAASPAGGTAGPWGWEIIDEDVAGGWRLGLLVALYVRGVRKKTL
jgi:hypothetical protein